MYAFDLTPDLCSASAHSNAVQKGSLGIEIQFSTTPTNAVSLFCYGEFENIIQIDAKRNVIYDYISYMNTAQISYALRTDPTTNKKFVGVFAADRLPKKINMQLFMWFCRQHRPKWRPRDTLGCLLISVRKEAQFCDSYGKPPEQYRKSFKDFMNNYDRDFNKRTLQSMWTNVCVWTSTLATEHEDKA